jgi:hypothetical protein
MRGQGMGTRFISADVQSSRRLAFRRQTIRPERQNSFLWISAPTYYPERHTYACAWAAGLNETVICLCPTLALMKVREIPDQCKFQNTDIGRNQRIRLANINVIFRRWLKIDFCPPATESANVLAAVSLVACNKIRHVTFEGFDDVRIGLTRNGTYRNVDCLYGLKVL